MSRMSALGRVVYSLREGEIACDCVCWKLEVSSTDVVGRCRDEEVKWLWLVPGGLVHDCTFRNTLRSCTR
jgi:hypothetical protein